jgi:hypothetical protein
MRVTITLGQDDLATYYFIYQNIRVLSGERLRVTYF